MSHTTTAPEGTTPDSTGRSDRRIWRKLLSNRNVQSLALVPVIIIALIVGTVISPAFMTPVNLFSNILAFSAALGVLVIAESIILIGGYFDLSLESTVGFSVVLLMFLSTSPDTGKPGAGLPLWLSLLIAVAVVILVGLFNGVVVSVLNLNAFIVTLAMLILLQGLTLGISNGQTYVQIPEFILYLGSGDVFGVPIQAVVFVVSFAIAALFMKYVPTGRAIYALGGSKMAARAAGIKVTRLSIGLFIFGSLMAMFAGLLLVGQVASVPSNLGNGMIFTVFAAAVLGGIDLNGGRGSVVGAALGVLLLAIIQNILTLSQVPSFWINAAYGGIIVIALLIGRLSPLRGRGASS
ncbi:ABC transporter permease [Microbacterium sp. DT81.1]|uniref:ABC transporter permease n=1 Tax=Microbacterium sp. DT81.1 TaxID=3393413 RepID=UPI003CEE1078